MVPHANSQVSRGVAGYSLLVVSMEYGYIYIYICIHIWCRVSCRQPPPRPLRVSSPDRQPRTLKNMNSHRDGACPGRDPRTVLAFEASEVLFS